MASEQRRPDVVERRKNFGVARRFVDLASLVFLDESGVQSNMTRLYGRAPRGHRCVDHTPQSHWKTATLISAIRVEGVVRQATAVFDGPMNRPTFEGYAAACLAPTLRPGDVVVMDNLSSHKSAAVIDAIESAGAELWFLPAYSPDLNPIEKLWSKVKAGMRRLRPRSFLSIADTLADSLRTVTAKECRNYFASCGYGTS
ncbi:MAG: IS630 family transposase [Planctomycetota bacterium]